MNKSIWVTLAIFFVSNLVVVSVGLGVFINKMDASASLMQAQTTAIKETQSKVSEHSQILIKIATIQEYTLQRLTALESK